MPDIPTTVGGLRAVELTFRPMRDIATGRSICFLSRTQLNTPGLGTLMPETFRPAAELSGQCRKLFPLEVMQLAESIRTLSENDVVFDWVSLEMPMRLLRDGATIPVINKICEQFSMLPNKICFSIPEKILTEESSAAADNITKLRKHGYHMLLSSFGDNECPFMKLSELAVDYVLLSPSVTDYIGSGERSDQAVHSIVTFINELGIEPVADGVKNSTQAEALYSFGCNYCVGPLSGEYKNIREMIE